MEYQLYAIKINTEGYYTVQETIVGDATHPQIQSGQDVWSQTIGLYNDYRYNARQEQVSTRRIIMSGIRHQGVLCQGLTNSEKVRLSQGIILIQPILWSTRDPDL